MKTRPETITPIYVSIAAFFVCFLMIANITAGRLISLFSLVLTGDLFLFPVTYIFGDILTEVYGFRYSRLVIWLGMACNIIMAFYFFVLLKTPYPADFVNNDAYQTVLGSTPLIVTASIIAYFLGEFANSTMLSLLKKATHGRFLFVRTIGSTLIGQLFDTLAFMLIAFSFLPFATLIQMIVIQYVFKVGYEILATPLTYLAVRWIKKHEALDSYDYGEHYNPFSLDLG
ncbi:transporter [Candidatus Wirthbacteria bacterium CG2_30_54_11]|uniref:Probable queuosine precursor transporter n=1 Tax=Candidatus Wirthbacteria bacterium CG2_30_54_11 TaxID=1817892 RepID=A0A1J5ISJ6_9BACT|nr:MAG: transporter [Candidatus Wirthbacteria bacterium CG2_30_54_11]